MNARRMAIAQAAAVFMLAFMPALVHAGTAQLNWTTPTQNTNGSALTNLAGYVVEYGSSASNLNQTLQINTPDATGTSVSGLATGTWFFTVRALNSAGIVSNPSNPVSVAVVDTPTCGAAPAPESRQQTCTAPLVGSWTQTHGWTSAPAPTCWTADPWTPATAPAGVCASPVLLTAGPYSYEVTGTTATPTMSAIGIVASGLSCGPAVRTVGTVKFCQITRAQTDLIGWPTDKTLAKGVWARAQ